MSITVEKGKNIVILILYFIVLANVYLLITTNLELYILIEIIPLILLFFMMNKGYQWAKWLTSLLLILMGLTGFSLILFTPLLTMSKVILIFITSSYLLSGSILILSPAVTKYLNGLK